MLDEKALARAVKRAMENAGMLPAKEAVKLVPADWHRICDLVLNPQQALSPGSTGEAEGCSPISDEPLEALSHARTTAANEIRPMSYEGADLTECVARILALFAAALAEKEAWSERGWKAYRIAHDQAMENGAAARSAEARALAAEAERDALKVKLEMAVAGERKRCLAIVEAQVPEWVKERSGPYWDGYREAMEDAADDMRKGASAAIRGEG